MSGGGNYITTADITSTLLSDYNLSGYVTLANNHLDGMADALITGSGYIATPVHYLIKDYLVNYASRAAVLDKVGTNNIEMGTDKYMILFDVYNKEVERLRPYITSEVLLNEVDEPADYARTSILMRS
jgi:hypothetical protein